MVSQGKSQLIDMVPWQINKIFIIVFFILYCFISQKVSFFRITLVYDLLYFYAVLVQKQEAAIPIHTVFNIRLLSLCGHCQTPFLCGKSLN